jgi:Ca-activated chloride channel homolog
MYCQVHRTLVIGRSSSVVRRWSKGDAMNVLWPWFLPLLALIPLIIAGYVWMQRRRKVGLRYSSLSLVRAAMPRPSRLRRHLPFALLMIGLTSLLLAMVRPVQYVTVPSGQATIILAIDVSGSMRQIDIPPSRLRAAKSAAISFIQRQRANTQIGIVAFAGYAELIQPPTTDQEALETAIDSLTTARGTAIGTGILQSIDAISEIDRAVAPSLQWGDTDPPPTPVPEGVYVPHVIVLLTDGVATTGVPPLEAAQQAADRGVRVYTIGFGTEQGSPGFGGGMGFNSGGQRFRRGIDDETMKQIADNTGAEYYVASSADELLSVFQNLPTYLITKTEMMEISAFFVAAGVALAILGMVLSMLWQPLL